MLVNIEVGIVKICDVCESSERPKGAHNVHRIVALPRVGALAWHQRVHCRDQQLGSRLHLLALSGQVLFKAVNNAKMRAIQADARGTAIACTRK